MPSDRPNAPVTEEYRTICSKIRWFHAAGRMEDACQLLANALMDERERIVEQAVEQRDRYNFWASHGHEGIYGDDGEMQCQECHVDYKRDAFAIVLAASTKAKLEWRERIVREARLEELTELRWRTRKKDYDLHPVIASYVDDRIAALAPAHETREQKATRFVRESGKQIHASDCATSCAPAEEPGPCDCDEPRGRTSHRDFA